MVKQPEGKDNECHTVT